MVKHIDQLDFQGFIKNEKSVSHFLPYLYHYDDCSLVCKDGSVLTVIQLAGIFPDTLDDAHIAEHKAAIARVIAAISDPAVTIYQHVLRREVSRFERHEFPQAFSADLEAQWFSKLARERLLVNDLYLTVVRQAPRQVPFSKSVFALFAKNDVAMRKAHRQIQINALAVDVQKLMAGLRAFSPQVLRQCEINQQVTSPALSFLFYLLNGDQQTLLLPRGEIARYLGRDRLFFGYDTLVRRQSGGDQYAAMLSIKTYCQLTAAGMLNELTALPFEMVISQSFSFVDQQQALKKLQTQVAVLDQSSDYSVSQRGELFEALDEVQSGNCVMGRHHLTLLLRSTSRSELDEQVSQVSATMSKLGLIVVREDLNLEAAFWSQFPGNQSFIARGEVITSHNFAGFASMHAQPTGHATGNHWGEAITVLMTQAHSPYFYNLHRFGSDVGFTSFIGPSGTGKTALLGVTVALMQQYQPRTVIFDKNQGNALLVNALGGQYRVLSAGQPTGFNPLQLRDTAANRLFIADWLCVLLESREGALSTSERQRVDETVAHVFDTLPADERRLRYIAPFLGVGQSDSLVARLRPWHSDGVFAYLFDNALDTLDFDSLQFETTVTGIDCTHILEQPLLKTAVFMYLDHCLDTVLDGKPSLLVIDEGWKYVADPYFSDKLTSWFKVLRRKNVVVIFVTNDIEDAANASVCSSLVTQTATNIFFPNVKADWAQYQKFDVSPREFEIIKTLGTHSRQFLLKQAQHSVVVSLDLTGMDEILTAVSSREASVRAWDELQMTKRHSVELGNAQNISQTNAHINEQISEQINAKLKAHTKTETKTQTETAPCTLS